jgi:divalent metal cation (Fe/Co/Zn/Cd) transporter
MEKLSFLCICRRDIDFDCRSSHYFQIFVQSDLSTHRWRTINRNVNYWHYRINKSDVGLYLLNVGKDEHSITLQADGRHLLTDTYTSGAIVLGLILIQLTNIIWLDSLLSVLVGFYIVYSGYKLTRGSVGGLMDESDFTLVEEVVDVLQKTDIGRGLTFITFVRSNMAPNFISIAM